MYVCVCILQYCNIAIGQRRVVGLSFGSPLAAGALPAGCWRAVCVLLACCLQFAAVACGGCCRRCCCLMKSKKKKKAGGCDREPCAREPCVRTGAADTASIATPTSTKHELKLTWRARSRGRVWSTDVVKNITAKKDGTLRWSDPPHAQCSTRNTIAAAGLGALPARGRVCSISERT